jgi:hypothetical protein
VTVYVDQARIPARVRRITGRWSHLLADIDDELHVFAAQLGLRRAWPQYPRHRAQPLRPDRRQTPPALALAAVPITRHQPVAILTQRRQTDRGGRPAAWPSRASPASTPGR